MPRIIAIVFAISLSGCQNASFNGVKSQQSLVGEWIGERTQSSVCNYLSWLAVRRSDGTYSVSFYSDQERTKEVDTENGKWWVEGRVFFEQLPGVMKEPDAYHYKVISKDEIEFEQISADKSADCIGNYKFRDFRVQSNASNKMIKRAPAVAALATIAAYHWR